MQHLEEQYENLYDFIKNFEILIKKNIFQGKNIEEVSHFGDEVMAFNELLMITPNNSKAYFTSLIENFYTDIIEPTKDEFY